MRGEAEGRDCGPRLMARPAGGAGCAAAETPREAIITGFPSTARLIELNRQAAAQAFSGYVPRMLLTLVVSLALSIAVVLLIIRLHELDAVLGTGAV